MIERLMNLECSFDEPEYNKSTERIIEIRCLLEPQLNQEGHELMDQLAGIYNEQSLALIRKSFINGFCAAAEIILEIWQHKPP